MQSEQFKISPEYFRELSIRQTPAVDVTKGLNQAPFSPFYHPSFFSALETSGSVEPGTGWQPQHLLLSVDSQKHLLPGYAKSHSYGEYIFDWNIADAVTRAGIRYYPKWVSQFPFTPVEAPSVKALQESSVLDSFQAALENYLQPHFLTAQLLYQPKAFCKHLESAGGLTRRNIGFKWQNHQYQNFDDFLSQLKSKPAKNIRQERRKVASLPLKILHYNGSTITRDVITRFYPFYQLTYLKRSGTHGYINLTAFTNWLMSIADHVYFIFAQEGERDVAATLFVADQNTLYGRYWGSHYADRLLHFELCYYRGIELCIEQGFQYFNPGVQGEHKVRRGFEPYWTYSSYFYFDTNLKEQIAQYFHDEAEQLREYRSYLDTKLPFKAI